MYEVDKLYKNILNIDNGYEYFTVNKQLKILKEIIKLYSISISYSIDAYYIKARSKDGKKEYFKVNNYFDECLASLINDLWQDLTNKQKQEIKNILE